VKKLLSVSFCIALVCSMLVGITGCPKKDDKATDKKAISAVAAPTELKIKQGADKATSKVTYTIGAEAKIKTIAVKCDNDKVKVSVDKDKLDKSGDATVTVEVAADAKVGDAVITVTATGDPSTPATLDTTVKVKVETK